jgi:hypothetical protein
MPVMIVTREVTELSHLGGLRVKPKRPQLRSGSPARAAIRRKLVAHSLVLMQHPVHLRNPST